MEQKKLLSISKLKPSPQPGEPLIAMTSRQLDGYTASIEERIRQQTRSQMNRRLSEAHCIIWYQAVGLVTLALVVCCLVR